MTLKTGLATALVAAVVAALVTAVTLVVIWRVAPGVVDAPSASLDEKKIVGVVHDYLTKNPEILVEMTTELDKRQQAEQASQQEKVISDNADALFRSPLSYSAGNPNGDVTVVEFFDYNCGFCRRALPDLVKLIDSDDKVKVVFKELPIFGEEFGSGGKGRTGGGQTRQIFRDAPEAVTPNPARPTRIRRLRIAAELGLDVPKLEKDMEDPSIQQALDETKDLAQKLGLQGTPLYLIGDRIVPGAPDDLYDQLTAKVAEVREKGCKATC